MNVNIGENADTIENSIGIIKQSKQCTTSRGGKLSVGGSPMNNVMKTLERTNSIDSLIK